MLILRVPLCGFILLLVSKGLADEPGAFNLLFQQNDYKIDFEWGQVVRYNKRHVKEFRVNVFKYNRTCTAGNVTFNYKFEVGNDLNIVIQAYKFASNEYRLFPIRFEVNICTGLVKNLVGSSKALACGNFTGCPVRKGRRYHICNWAPDISQFPPFIPNGRYKLDVQGTVHGEEMWLGNAFGKVYRPIVVN